MNSGQPIRLVQVTDPHLRASEEGTLLGLETQASLSLIWEKIRQQKPNPDAIIATGDIAQDSSAAAYSRFVSQLQDFNIPARWCPGNHDLPERMAEAATGTSFSDRYLDLGVWGIILLDSTQRGQVGGEFNESELVLAEELIDRYSDQHLMICCHHQPIPMHSAWIDEQQIKNGDLLVNMLKRKSQVKALVWGHVHQDSDRDLGSFRAISTPSTSVQFTPFSDEFDIDHEDPGFRWFDLHADGTFVTGVERLTGVDFGIDYDIKGY